MIKRYYFHVSQIKRYETLINVVIIKMYERLKIKLTLLIGSRLQHRRVKRQTRRRSARN